jgi:hypothetical protein
MRQEHLSRHYDLDPELAARDLLMAPARSGVKLNHRTQRDAAVVD